MHGKLRLSAALRRLTDYMTYGKKMKVCEEIHALLLQQKEFKGAPPAFKTVKDKIKTIMQHVTDRCVHTHVCVGVLCALLEGVGFVCTA